MAGLLGEIAVRIPSPHLHMPRRQGEQAPLYQDASLIFGNFENVLTIPKLDHRDN